MLPERLSRFCLSFVPSEMNAVFGFTRSQSSFAFTGQLKTDGRASPEPSEEKDSAGVTSFALKAFSMPLPSIFIIESPMKTTGVSSLTDSPIFGVSVSAPVAVIAAIRTAAAMNFLVILPPLFSLHVFPLRAILLVEPPPTNARGSPT